MRILGVDPGLTRCGIGVVSLESGSGIEFQHVEVLQTASTMELPERLGVLGASLEQLIRGGGIDEVALERVFAQQNLPSVMGVAHISGVVMYLAARERIPVTLYTPNEIKSRITGYGAADKSQVANMVVRHLGLQQVPKPADAADALALAITHAFTLRTGLSQKRQSNAAKLTPAQVAWQQAERKAKSRKA